MFPAVSFFFFLERGRGSVYQGQTELPTAFANDGRVFQSSWHGQVISLVAQGRAACEVSSVVLFIILKFEVLDREIHLLMSARNYM